MNWTSEPPPPPYHEALLSASRRLIDEEQVEKYQLAVVMAQAACEVLTEQVITALVERLEPASLRSWIRKRVPRPNDLDEPRVRDLYRALTGDELKYGEGIWQQYAVHVKRRHKVVHRGETVSKDDATHSYDIARKVIDYLLEVQTKK